MSSIFVETKPTPECSLYVIVTESFSMDQRTCFKKAKIKIEEGCVDGCYWCQQAENDLRETEDLKILLSTADPGKYAMEVEAFIYSYGEVDIDISFNKVED